MQSKQQSHHFQSTCVTNNLYRTRFQRTNSRQQFTLDESRSHSNTSKDYSIEFGTYIKPEVRQKLTIIDNNEQKSIAQKLSKFTQKQIKNINKTYMHDRNNETSNDNNLKKFQQLLKKQRKIKNQIEDAYEKLKIKYLQKCAQCQSLKKQVKQNICEKQQLIKQINSLSNNSNQTSQLIKNIQDYEIMNIKLKQQIEQLSMMRQIDQKSIIRLTEQVNSLRKKSDKKSSYETNNKQKQNFKKNILQIQRMKRQLQNRDKQLQRAQKYTQQLIYRYNIKQKRFEEQKQLLIKQYDDKMMSMLSNNFKLHQKHHYSNKQFVKISEFNANQTQ